jgi:hypothetical protein
MTPVEELRAAAQKVREAASAVIHLSPPWRSEPAEDDQWRVMYGTPHLLAGLVATTPDYGRMYLADWIALMHPGLAEPIAAWLEGCATDLDRAEAAAAAWTNSETGDPLEYCDEPDSVRRALDLARAILQTPKETDR